MRLFILLTLFFDGLSQLNSLQLYGYCYILTLLFSISFKIVAFKSAIGKLLRNSASSLACWAGGTMAEPVFNFPTYLLSLGDLNSNISSLIYFFASLPTLHGQSMCIIFYSHACICISMWHGKISTYCDLHKVWNNDQELLGQNSNLKTKDQNQIWSATSKWSAIFCI